jgi:hypothetical protein
LAEGFLRIWIQVATPATMSTATTMRSILRTGQT